MNEFDIQLYEFAYKKFKQTMASQPHWVKNEIRRFKTLNSNLLGRLLLVYAGLKKRILT